LVALYKHHWLAAVFGILLTGLPVLWFTSWLQKQGEAEAIVVAQRAIDLLELQLDQAASVLDELAGSRVDSCAAEHREALRRAVFLGGTIKEIALIAAGGQTQCTDAGTPLGDRVPLATAATSRGEFMLDVVRPSDLQERMLRVRRLGTAGKPQLAALIPAGLLLRNVRPTAGTPSGYVRMTLADGTLIGSAGSEPQVGSVDNYVSGYRRSERYGPLVRVIMAREGVIATYDDLRRIGMVVTGLLALVILAMALLIPLRHRRSPMSELERAMLAGGASAVLPAHRRHQVGMRAGSRGARALAQA
jgi:sensor c-di-GMP phosphodiesterase-like protein